jgi:putative membrane protein
MGTRIELMQRISFKSAQIRCISSIRVPIPKTLMETKYLIASLVYSLLGIVILVVSFVIIEKLAPENLWKEIVDKQNVALAILAAGFMLAVSLIIASAIHG